MPQLQRHTLLVAMSTAAAALAVYAGAPHTSDSILSSTRMAAQGSSVAAEVTIGRATPVSAVQDSASGGVPPVQAPAEALLSHSRSLVHSVAEEGIQPFNPASSRLYRPTAGTLMAPLEVLVRSSPYGLRTSPITGSAGEFHWGLDFSAPCGTKVYSADAGMVRAVGWHHGGGGNRVEVDHGNGLITTYNHLEGIAVAKGEPVQAGGIIATVGTTGASTGCHLHFETILNGSYTDPEKWALLPLAGSEPLAGVTMVDYGSAHPTTAAPAWAGPAAHSHYHEAGRGHESQGRIAPAAKPSQPASAAIAAPAPSPMLASPLATPMAPALAPVPSPSDAPLSKALPSSAPTAAPASPAPAPTPSPAVTPGPVPAPLPARNPMPHPASRTEPEPTPVLPTTGPRGVPPLAEPATPAFAPE